VKLPKLLTLFAVVATAASASTIASLQFTGFPSSSTVLFSANITIGGGPTVATQLLCDDIAHSTPRDFTTVFKYDVTYGTDPLQWTDARWDLAASAFSGHSHNGTDTYLVRYRAAAILLAELLGQLGAPATGLTGMNFQNAIQAATWDLFYTGVGSVPAWSTAIKTLQDDAVAKAKDSAYASVYNRLVIYTPDPTWLASTKNPGYNPQEFIALTAVPEPSQAAGLLLALGLGWYVRRRKTA